MEVKLDHVNPTFAPRTIRITVESEEELTVLRRLASTNVSVPTAVFGKGGYWQSSSKKNEKYEILYDFLGKLHRSIRETKFDE